MPCAENANQTVVKGVHLDAVSAVELGEVWNLHMHAIFVCGTERAQYGKAVGNNGKRIL